MVAQLTHAKEEFHAGRDRVRHNGFVLMIAPARAETLGKWSKGAPFPEPSVLRMMPMPRHGLAGAVGGDRLHVASGDIQSAGITGMRVVTGKV